MLQMYICVRVYSENVFVFDGLDKAFCCGVNLVWKECMKDFSTTLSVQYNFCHKKKSFQVFPYYFTYRNGIFSFMQKEKYCISWPVK